MKNIHAGDRRTYIDRREISYAFVLPEKRSGTDRRSGIERRKHKRLPVKDLAFAKLWSENEKDYVQEIGQLLDISKGGLSVRSSVEQKKPSEQSLLGIFISGSEFNIENIPFKIISDLKLTIDSSLSRRTLRRYGIQFEELTSDQKNKLDHFITQYDVKESKFKRL